LILELARGRPLEREQTFPLLCSVLTAEENGYVRADFFFFFFCGLLLPSPHIRGGCCGTKSFLSCVSGDAKRDPPLARSWGTVKIPFFFSYCRYTREWPSPVGTVSFSLPPEAIFPFFGSQSGSDPFGRASPLHEQTVRAVLLPFLFCPARAVGRILFPGIARPSRWGWPMKSRRSSLASFLPTQSTFYGGKRAFFLFSWLRGIFPYVLLPLP